jgi:hypothetical protein
VQPPAVVRGVPGYWPPLNYRPAPHHLYENLGDGAFRDVSEASGIRAPEAGRGLGVIAGDFNGDGHADLYVANDMSANFMFLGDGKGRFREEAYFNGTALSDDGMPLGSMGLAVADYDGDGASDLFVTNYQDQPNNLYRGSKSGHFEDLMQLVGRPSHSLPDVAWGVGFADFNHDGWVDLMVVNGHLNPETQRLDPTTRYAQPKHIYRNRGDGGFEDVSERSGDAVKTPRVSRGAAFGDIDNDGDVDVVVNDSIGPAELLRNDGEAGGAWALLRLVGSGRNRDAIGARVVVTAAGRRQERERRSASSYLSADDPRLHFGLGGAARIDRIEVRWPGGAVQAHEGLPVRRLLVIRQGEERWEALEIGAQRR